MNRRGFLTTLLKTAGGIIVTPSIVTHGLKLRPVSQLPIALRYTSEDIIYGPHTFLSPIMNFYPTFQDFLNTLEK